MRGGECLTAIARVTATLALVASCVVPTAPRAADGAVIRAVVDRAVLPLMKEHDVPGLAVGVTAGGKQHFFYYGVASKEASAPVNADTLFEIGSISKMFTATLASYAQAQGRLSLNDHPGQYMPALRGSALDKASLINLGTYTAGLPLHLPNAIKTFAEAEAFLQNLKIKAEPGAVRLYSNPSVGLVGHIAALAMNANFPDLMETQLLPKLGVTDCFIRIPSSRAQDLCAGLQGQHAAADGAGGVRCRGLWVEMHRVRTASLRRGQYPAGHA